ncbi:MAG: hypothetical protein FWE42_00270 [Defluviitaleaceae bacterium]|nr:hypothetical protein [Defluviitaleaceae bacterium]
MDAYTNDDIIFGVKHGRGIITVFVVVAVILFAIAILVSSPVARVFLVIFGLVSVGLCISSMADVRRFKKYAHFIFLQNITSVSQMGALLKKSNGTVESELKNLIALGYFPNTKVEDGEILLNVKEDDNEEESNIDENKNEEAPARVMRTCPGCGAPSKVEICEFCGSITR